MGVPVGSRRACGGTDLPLLARLSVFAAVLGTIWGPVSAGAGDLTITPSVSVSETVSDNVDLDHADEEPALITTITPGLRIRSESARVTAALDVLPTLRHQTAGDDKGLSLDESLSGFSTVEVAEDLFFVDAQASISQQVLDTRAAATTANQETVQVYRLSPVLRTRLGGFADAEARYTLGQVFVGGEGVSDATRHGLGFTLKSGSDFTRLLWSLAASASESDRSDAEDISRRDVDLGVEYAVMRSFSVIAGAGYQSFDDGIPANEIDGPTWRAGFRMRPGPRTELEATYGQREDSQNVAAQFRYDIGPRTRLTAGYSETLRTSQERLDETLSRIGLGDDDDGLIDEPTEEPFDPHPSPFDIRDETTRVQAFRVGVDGTRGRNTFAVTAVVANEETEPTGEQEDVITAGASWTRQLSRRLTLNVFGGYERIEFENGQEDDEYILTGGLSYKVFTNIHALLTYGFRMQDSTLETSEFAENRITLGLRATF